MKSLQLGLVVALVGTAIALAAFFGSALWAMTPSLPSSQEPPPAQEPTADTSAVQAIGIVITATVGTFPDRCATTNRVQVRAGTTVFYCFTVKHTGVAGDAQLTLHRVRTSRGEDRELRPPPSEPDILVLDPGEVVSTYQAGLVFSDSASVDVTNFITWTAQPQDGQTQVIGTSRAFIDVVRPEVTVTKYVGQDRNNCAAGRTITVPRDSDIAFCISLENTGEMTFTSHTITDQPLSINSTFNYTLFPGQTLEIIPTNMTQLGISNGSLERLNITSGLVNNASVTSRAANGLSATGASTATVSIGTTTVRMIKTVSTEQESCRGSSTIQAPPGTRVYYCVVLENTGAVTLTNHNLTESFLSIDVDFEYPLAPGQVLTITNGFLAARHLPVVFGPFELHPSLGLAGKVIDNTMVYEGSSPDGFSVTAQADTRGTFPPTPTTAPTERPDPTRTPTPGPTSTPSNTPTSTPVTPSPTPTFTPITPSPTPTRSYAISLLETPTPRNQIAAIPNTSPELGSPELAQQPTLDPNQQTPPLPGQESPLQDPFVATATQIAVDATITAVAAQATASQLAVEDAQATALAESQPESPLVISPLATPTLDPSLVQSGELPVEPGLETPTEMPAPGSDVTVLPPLVTAVVGTETPAVVVLVVTNTPEPGMDGAATVLPEGQRPIVLPTPTATPDFVMAAAHTFDVAVTTFSWLWFLVGSLIFFVTAGIVAGLFFRQSETGRYDLPEPDYWLEEEADRDRSHLSPAGEGEDDEWPAELP
jgi:hypothetical protein